MKHSKEYYIDEFQRLQSIKKKMLRDRQKLNSQIISLNMKLSSLRAAIDKENHGDIPF
jgi:hypothetical protein